MSFRQAFIPIVALVLADTPAERSFGWKALGISGASAAIAPIGRQAEGQSPRKTARVKTPRALGPSWVKGSSGKGLGLGRIQPNQSFLSDTQRNIEKLREDAFVASIMNPVRAAELRMEYEAATREYQQQQVSGRMNPVTEAAWMNRMENTRREAIREVQRTQVRETRENVAGAVKRGEISTPILASATLASLYLGLPVQVELSSSTRIEASTNFVEDRAQFRLMSDWVQGQFDFTGNPQGVQQAQLDPTQVQERYRFSLTRNLSIWNLSSGLIYGATSQSVSAQISKPIANNLTCVVDTRRPLTGNAMPAEEKVTLQYGIRF